MRPDRGGSLCHRVQPVPLRLAAYDDELSVPQHDVPPLLRTLVHEGELACRAQAQRRNRRMGAVGRLAITVPCHALTTVVVKLEHAGIEARLRQVLGKPPGAFEQVARPWLGLAGHAGVDIAERPVAEPQGVACRFGGHTIDHGDVRAPGQLRKQVLVQGVSFGGT